MLLIAVCRQTKDKNNEDTLPAMIGRERITVIVCMYIGYLMLMFCRTAFTTVSPALVEDPGLSLTTTHIGDILGYAALGSLVGKLLTGFFADRFGGRLTLLLALGVVASLTMAMGYLASFFAFALCIFCLQLLRAGGWPALTKLIGQWIPPTSYGRTWGVLVGFIDATGYAAEAAFMPYAGRLADQPGGWTHFMWLLFVIACAGLVSTVMFLYRDHRFHQGSGDRASL